MLLHVAEQIPPKPVSNVAFIIPCHNYGKYLNEAISSLIAQTVLPVEIIVVDDASDDDTKEIALAYNGHGVKYINIHAKNVHQARKTGFLESTAEIVCFLDADDKLPPKWLESGLDHFTDKNVGLVYCDAQRFGNGTNLITHAAKASRDLIARANFAVSCSLVRRQALVLTDAFDLEIDQELALDDWFIWRRVAQYGWKLIKQSEKLWYRLHDRNMLTMKANQFQDKYFESVAMQHETITIFVPLSGRLNIWHDHLSKYLERQQWPHAQCRLIFTNSSQNKEFTTAIRTWIANCDYQDVRHIEFIVDKDPELAERDRFDKNISHRVDLACSRIYNRLAHAVETDYAWIIEDDIIPPDNAAEQLLRTFTHSTASCSGCYKSRFNNGYVIRKGTDWLKRPAEGGVEQIDDSGFGCLMIRSEFIRNHVFYITSGHTWYDTAFFATIPTEFGKMVHWDCECLHLQK